MAIGESGPDLSSFSDAGGNAAQGGAAAVGGLISQQLANAATSLDAAATKLNQSASGKGSGGTPIYNQMMGSWAGYTPQGPSQSANGGGPAFGGALGAPANIGPPLTTPNTGFPKPVQAPATQGSAFPPLAGNPMSPNPPYPNMGGMLGTPSTPPPTPPSGGGGLQQGLGTAASMAGGLMGAAAGYGSANMTSQIALNTYQTLGSQMIMNGGNSSYNQTKLAQQALGTAGNTGFGWGSNNQMLNDLAFNSQDAVQAFSIMQAMSGNAFVGSTSFGQQVLGGTAMFGYLNPGMSQTQAAALNQQMYQPSTSLAMLQSGLSVTPRIAGVPGGTNSNAAVAAGLLQQLFPRGTTNANIAMQNQPSMLLNSDLSAYGMNPSAMTSVLQEVNTLMQGANGQKPMSTSQIQNLFNQIGTTQSPQAQNAAKATLSRYGLKTSDLNSLKALAGTQSAQISDTSGGFTQGLQSSTRALSDFNTGIYRVLNTLKASGLVGNAQGFLGGLQQFGSGTLLGSAAGMLSGLGSMLHAEGIGIGVPSGTSSGSAKSTVTTNGGVSAQAREAVSAAETQLGVPYVWGGEQPGKGFDCSGLVQWAYARAGVNLPRTSEAQWSALQNRAIPLNAVQEGDLIFTAGSDGTPNDPGHVAIMVSGNKLIQAPYTGADVQIIGYSPGQWSHAARPSGSTAGLSAAGGLSGAGGGGVGTGPGVMATTGGTGDTTAEGSTSEVSAIQGAVAGGISAGSGYYGNPGGGFGGAAGTSANSATGGTTSVGTMTPGQIESLWTNLGGPSGAAANMARIAMAESGDNPSVVQSGQSPGMTGYGLYQITPTSGISQNGQFGNLLNASNNTKAAIWLYRRSGYSPWSSDPVGAGLSGMALGGVAEPGQVAVVGERGPELVQFGSKANVHSSAQTQKLMQAAVAQGPYQSSPGSAYTYSTASPVYGGTTGKSVMSGGGIQMNFGSSSIVVNLPVTQSASALTSGAAARTVATQIVDQLSKMNIDRAIRSGANS
jgi:cell wall-associated NlpC family hydrolase